MGGGEVEGVAGLSNPAGGDIAELIGIRTLTKGVKVQFSDDKIIVDTSITVAYGCNLLKVARAVQDRVMNTILASTGLEKAEINVHVTGIAFEK